MEANINEKNHKNNCSLKGMTIENVQIYTWSLRHFASSFAFLIQEQTLPPFHPQDTLGCPALFIKLL
jgi:hypothetical protein